MCDHVKKTILWIDFTTHKLYCVTTSKKLFWWMDSSTHKLYFVWPHQGNYFCGWIFQHINCIVCDHIKETIFVDGRLFVLFITLRSPNHHTSHHALGSIGKPWCFLSQSGFALNFLFHTWNNYIILFTIGFMTQATLVPLMKWILMFSSCSSVFPKLFSITSNFISYTSTQHFILSCILVYLCC